MEQITLIQWFIAFSAMLVRILKNINVAQEDNKFTFTSYFRKKGVAMLATLILLPVVLLVCTDSSLNQILPINNVTAFLAGFQTDWVCDAIVELSKAKINKNKENV